MVSATPAAKEGAPAHRLISLEAGRFFAAASVMLFHYTGVVANARGGVRVFDNLLGVLHFGVPYFFVLSGFIIYHIHAWDLGQPRTVGRFAAKRAIRLLPMFWLISLAMLAGFIAMPALAGDRSITPLGVIADLLLLPHGEAILSISWTLRHETVFYALFALAILFGRKALWLVAIWAGISLFGPPTTFETLGSASLLASSHNLGFVFGILIAMALERWGAVRPALFTAIGAGMIVAMIGVEWSARHNAASDAGALGVVGSILYLIASTALIYGMVGLERTRPLPGASMWKVLGGASYVLYLIHQPIASVAMRLFRSLPPELTYVAIAVLALAASVALHLIVERPVLRWLSARFGTRASSSAGMFGAGEVSGRS